MKKLAKHLIVSILANQVNRLRLRNNIKIVGVVGSIGKTSTKLAIGRVLSTTLRVQYQDGNYNDLVSVPLVFFGEAMPSLFNPLAWATLLLRNEAKIRNNYPYDVVVVEIGTDGPGQIALFSTYLELDIAVVTAIAMEHMEYFSDLNAVATEEFSVSNYSKKLVLNNDLSEMKYVPQLKQQVITYGMKDSDYRIEDIIFNKSGVTFAILKQGGSYIQGSHKSISNAQLYSLTAAAVVADELGLNETEIMQGFINVKPVSGRMQLLKGINQTTIIDDTYNASPEAVKASLKTLYDLSAPRKIALLGNMNELGIYSEQEHTDVGLFCNPSQLDLVVTLGPDANKFLAAAARRNGCKVEECQTPYQAAEIIKKYLIAGAIVLAKGSQNMVFAEEAIKLLLADSTDSTKLVRQSESWLAKKAGAFKR